MANSNAISGIWYLDTAGTAVVDSRIMYVKYVRWVSVSATTGDRVILKDKFGNQWWESTAPGPEWLDSSPYFPRNFADAGSKKDDRLVINGLIAATIGSGAVYVFFDRA